MQPIDISRRRKAKQKKLKEKNQHTIKPESGSHTAIEKKNCLLITLQRKKNPHTHKT